MSIKKLSLFFLVATGLSLFVSCNNKSRSNSGPCPTGYTATPAGCAPIGGNGPINYIPPANGVVQYYSAINDYMTNGNTFEPTENYRTFLRDALGVCDRCSNSGGGVLACESWINGFNMLMISLSPQLNQQHQLAVYTTPTMQNSSYFAWQFPDIDDFFISVFTGAPAPSCNPGQFSPYWASDMQYDSTNNGNGFVLFVNQGPFYSAWNLYKFRLFVPNGKLGDPQFEYRFEAINRNGATILLGTGTLNRCRTRNCGLN